MKSIPILVVLSWLGASACGSSASQPTPEPTPEPTRPAEPLESMQGEGNVLAPSMAFGADGTLAVAWAENKNLVVRRWTNSRWETLGGPLSAFTGDTPAFWSSVQVDVQGNPVVAWEEQAPSAPIRNSIIVQRWDGSAGRWVQLGTPLNIGSDTTDAYKPSLRLDSQGTPLVAWSENLGIPGQQIAVRRWSPSGWQSLGDNPVAVGTAWGLELVGDVPVLVSQLRTKERMGNHTVVEVRRWTGSTWERLGDPVGDNAVAPQLRADAAGHLFLTWLDEEYFPELPRIRVFHWSGTAWEPLGADVEVAQDEFYPGAPQLVLDAEGQPLVAWRYNGMTSSLRFARWTGRDWNVKVLENSTVSEDGWCALAFHPREGAVVAWTPREQSKLQVLQVP